MPPPPPPPHPSTLPFPTQLALSPVPLQKNTYTTLHPPSRMGNPSNIAYGGYVLAVAAKAAGLTVPKGYNLYSMLGTFLGPALTDYVLLARVSVLRQTRTFATRRVEVLQRWKTKEGGEEEEEERVCLTAVADFMVREPASLIEYSRAPAHTYPRWSACPTQKAVFTALFDDGKISKDMLDAQANGFSLLPVLYEQRMVPSAIFAQNLFGVAKSLPHSQDNLPPAKRTTADWFRAKDAYAGPEDHIASLAFIIDGAISLGALGFNHLWFEDVAAVSSLEFALRVFVGGKEDGGLDMNGWHLREISSNVAGEGRSFGESWVWDESGRAVACMSQQSILRPRPLKKGKL
ncbi:Thioesterase/thiol ester dehydrase-isomerase [Pyrenochaeta sp. DS3sAY3a]|nr:Thioesterase/thiol ester dehydrase-isomerase [Pyrenochaeta sp. DS3sAY3a]